MNAVTNEPGGTAYAWRIPEPGFEMAGKTGTAQVRRITQGRALAGVDAKNDELPWKLRDHALFIAFAPVDKPRYAAVDPPRAWQHAHSHPQVQIARDILLFAQKRDTLEHAAPPIRSTPPSTCAGRAGDEFDRALRRGHAHAFASADKLLEVNWGLVVF